MGHRRRPARRGRPGRGRGAAPAGFGCSTRPPSTRRTDTAGGSSSTRRLLGSVARAALDLTYKEFELLKYLAQHPGRVFTRAQLLQEVWGYDYFGGTRTVDVHVRRLRAKLGAEHEGLIGTVRNVGYRFVPRGRGLLLRARGLTWRAPSASPRSTQPTLRPSCDPAVVARRAEADGVGAISEAFRLAVGPHSTARGVVHLRHGMPTTTWSATPKSPGQAPRMPSPSWWSTRRPRRRGHGRTLLDAALAEGTRSVWAHGMLPAADALARFRRARADPAACTG